MSVRRRFCTAALFEQQRGQMWQPLFRFRARNTLEYEAWRSGLLKGLKEALGPFEGRKKCPEIEFISSREFGGFVRHKIAYGTWPGVKVPAYLQVPKGKGERMPAVLCVHGHVPRGKEGVVFRRYALGSPYSTDLVKLGMVTLAPDNAGMGERAETFRQHDCELVWRRLNLVGRDLTGYRVQELMWALDLLEGIKQVDPGRIGVAGLSGGCWLGMVLAALDERVRAAVLSGFVTSFLQTLWHGHCICHHPKGLGMLCEMADIAGLIAPRAVFVESGREDVAYPVEPTFGEMRRIWDFLGAGKNLRLHIYQGGHMFHGSVSLPWLAQRLSSLPRAS